MSPPAMLTGTLPFTAFCLLTERAPAHCSVSAFWIPICAAPGPPQPSLQEEPPTFCSWSCFCVVSASLDAFASDSELAGTLPFTAFCLLTERAPAHCSVSAFWTPIWAPPAPPLPELSQPQS